MKKVNSRHEKQNLSNQIRASQQGGVNNVGDEIFAFEIILFHPTRDS